MPLPVVLALGLWVLAALWSLGILVLIFSRLLASGRSGASWILLLDLPHLTGLALAWTGLRRGRPLWYGAGILVALLAGLALWAFFGSWDAPATLLLVAGGAVWLLGAAMERGAR